MYFVTSAAVASILALLSSAGLYVLTEKEYGRIAKATPIAIDEYVHQRSPHVNSTDNKNPKVGIKDQLQSVLMHHATRYTRKIHQHALPVVAEPDKYIPNLYRTRAARKTETPTVLSRPKSPLIIGTIRMGYGHHRLSYAVASYATANKSILNERDVYFHDIVEMGDQEAALPETAEYVYSKASRAMTEAPNKLERSLSQMSSNGGPNALRLQAHTASLMTALMGQQIPKDSPIIATHPLVGMIAISAGYTNVINLVVDNHAQWFVIVPKALNLIQGPRLYRELLKMGVPAEDMELVGNWNPKNIVDTIPEATERRISRRTQEKPPPLRLLVPVGGAGAQESFLCDFVKACAPLVREGKVELWLNAGDHDHMHEAFAKQLKKLKLDYNLVSDVESRDKFVKGVEGESEKNILSSISNLFTGGSNAGVTLFAFNNSYAGVSTTDHLTPFTDVLVCKPSEMAFYAVPKLMIRRVGDHERKSAVRAAEVGDGTLEAATIEEVMADIEQMLEKPSDLVAMNRNIQKNNEIGMYDGAKIAVERALERAAAGM